MKNLQGKTVNHMRNQKVQIQKYFHDTAGIFIIKVNIKETLEQGVKYVQS